MLHYIFVGVVFVVANDIFTDDVVRNTNHIPCVHGMSIIVSSKVSGIPAGDTFRNIKTLYQTILSERQEIRSCVYVVSIVFSRKVSGHTFRCMLHSPRPVHSNHAYPTGRPTSSAPDILAPESKSASNGYG